MAFKFARHDRSPPGFERTLRMRSEHRLITALIVGWVPRVGSWVRQGPWQSGLSTSRPFPLPIGAFGHSTESEPRAARCSHAPFS